MRSTPSVEEIHTLGEQIGIPHIPVFPYYTKWWNVLHELGHYAVKKDEYINLWRQHKDKNKDKYSEVPYFSWFNSSYELWKEEQKANIPGLIDCSEKIYDFDNDFILSKDDIKQCLELENKWHKLIENDVLERIDSKKEEEVKYQSTPGEWGVRLWCLRVLEVKGWINPMDCKEWRSSRSNDTGCKREQWQLEDYQGKIAARQLQNAGIDFSRGDVRPIQIPITVGISISLGEINATYSKDFRVMKVSDRNYQIQLQHDIIVNKLIAHINNSRRWKRWISSGILALPSGR